MTSIQSDTAGKRAIPCKFLIAAPFFVSRQGPFILCPEVWLVYEHLFQWCILLTLLMKKYETVVPLKYIVTMNSLHNWSRA